jgi:AraC family transcriptional regulator
VPFSRRSEEPTGTREGTAIFIDPFTLAEIAQAKNGVVNLDILPQVAIRDSLIWEIGLALENALVSVPPAPASYAESLAAALASHILFKYTKRSTASHFRSATLNSAQLWRSIEFIHDNLHRNLTLEEMAAVANMSKYHFAKSFGQTMGVAPHHYLVDLRVAKARKLLSRDNSMTLSDVANVVGYSDKSHFIAQFFKIVGTTPHHYRKQVQPAGGIT